MIERKKYIIDLKENICKSEEFALAENMFNNLIYKNIVFKN